MKQASSRELFGYWTARRGTRAAPERGEIEPSAIRRALGDMFILEFDRRAGHPFRLAGTRVCALFGRELKNEPFLESVGRGNPRQVAQLLAVVADEATGVVAGVKGTHRRRLAARSRTRCCCRSRIAATRHARMIGALAPFDRAVLARRIAARRADARQLRHLDPALEAPAAARSSPAAERHRPARVFTVL